MGMFLGKILVETPKHKVLEKGENYEVREYNPWVVAEVTYDPVGMRMGRDGGFFLLAGFIGAFGKPANIKAGGEGYEGDKGEKVDMTAPVITQASGPEPIAMTAPVITQESKDEAKSTVTMQFVMPSKYTMETVPKPSDPRVVVKEIPGRKYAVITFSGVANESLTQKKLAILEKGLQETAYKPTGEHFLARYNDPWTPWFLRTNEVFLPVE